MCTVSGSEALYENHNYNNGFLGEDSSFSFLIQGVPGGNVPDFGRMFLTLKYTDITQNTFVYPKLNGYGDNGERSLKV